jgi:hypothetical protein
MAHPFVEQAAAGASRATMPLFALAPEVECVRQFGGGWVDETGTTRIVQFVHRSVDGGQGYVRITMALRPDRGTRREAAWWVAHMGIVRSEIERVGGLDVAVEVVMREKWEPIELPVDGRLVSFELVRRARDGGRWRHYWGACAELDPGLVVSLAGADLDVASVRLTTLSDLEPFIDGTRKILGGQNEGNANSG